MKVLILGGTGVISRQIVEQAAEKHEITMFNRNNKNVKISSAAELIVGDRYEKDFAEKALSAKPDVVIDMICFNIKDAKQTIEVFGSHVKQIIVTSSIAAYDRPYHSYPIREDAEHLGPDKAFSYGCDKAEMDRYLQSQMGKHKAAITVIRPSLTFGPGAMNFGILRQNRNVVRRILQNKPLVMTGEGAVPWVFTFAKDLAQAYALSIGNTNTFNNSFHVTGEQIVQWEDLYRTMGKLLGRTVSLVNIPSVLLKEAFPQTCAHLYYEKVYFSVFSLEKFRRAVPEYKPCMSLEEGLQELIEWWEKENVAFDEEKERWENEICKSYEELRARLNQISS